MTALAWLTDRFVSFSLKLIQTSQVVLEIFHANFFVNLRVSLFLLELEELLLCLNEAGLNMASLFSKEMLG